MENSDSPWRISRPQTNQSYVGLYFGHEHASDPSISNQIGTSRIPMIKSIILNSPNKVLTYPRVGIRAKYKKNKGKKSSLLFWSCLVSNSMKMMDL